jgi:hypothetical protein
MLMQRINIADMADKAFIVQRFDGFIAQSVNIHSLTTDEMLHLTYYLRRAAFIIGAVKGRFAFLAFKQVSQAGQLVI